MQPASRFVKGTHIMYTHPLDGDFPEDHDPVPPTETYDFAFGLACWVGTTIVLDEVPA